MKNDDKLRYLLTISILILISLTCLYILRAYHHYSQFEYHREYIKEGSPQIQTWMAPHTISKRFNISEDLIYTELGIAGNSTSRGLPMDRICTQNHINCTKVVEKLDALRQR